MDSFDVVVFVWLLSAAVVTIIGFLRGWANEALTLGILFGPFGVVMAWIVLARNRAAESRNDASAIPLRGTQRAEQVAELPIRRAA